MYVVRNNGRFPVVIRDLNYHIQGGKSVDIDLIFRRETSEKSVDLKNLIKCKKVEILNKSKYTIEKQQILEKTAPKENVIDNKSMVELMNEIKGVRQLLEQGVNLSVSGGSKQEVEEYSDSTKQQIAELQARSLSEKENEVKKNFKDIGNVTEKKGGSVKNMLDILDSLDEQGE